MVIQNIHKVYPKSWWKGIKSKQLTTKWEDYDKNIPWTIIESYCKNKHLEQLVKHQLESYNYFINSQIENTIEMFNPVRIVSEHDYIKKHDIYRLEIYINFTNFCIYRPQVYENNGATKIMFPHEARLRNFTYAGTMNVDINIKYIIDSKIGVVMEPIR